LSQVERQVCGIELGGGAIGTGFLVGPDAVLTNWQVFNIAKRSGRTGQLACRFNDRPNAIGVHAGGCLDSRPLGGGEKLNAEMPLPTPDELDYALLRLASRAGDEQVDGKYRGWIALPSAVAPLQFNAAILIVQQPLNTPMKLALDTQAVIGLNGNGTRLRYCTHTELGSSGSPVFTMDWDIVALHHFAYHEPARFSQGVPIQLIRQRIDRSGFGIALVA
jgi:Trypsin-like peptidase domain